MAAGTLATSLYVAAPINGRLSNNSAQLFVMGLPPRQDVGYLRRAVAFSLFLYNGTAADVTLAGIAGNPDADGILWDTVLPDLIERGTSSRVNITVGITGPVQFEATLTFLSPCTSPNIFTIIGSRGYTPAGVIGNLFTEHNWDGGLRESLAWLTDVMIAYDRTEQRVQLRNRPRRKFELRLLATGSERRYLENILAARRVRFYLLPVFRDMQSLPAVLPAGSAVIAVNTQFFDYAVDRQVALWDRFDHYEIHTIAALSESAIVLDAPTLSAWPAGAKIAPCRYAEIIEQRVISRVTDDAAEYGVTAEVLGETRRAPVTTLVSYEGYQVCPFAAGWHDDGDTIDHKWIRLDNDTGVMNFEVQSTEPVLTRTLDFLLAGRAVIDEFLSFLSERAGRLSPFWVATLNRDLAIVGAAAAGDTVITVTQMDYERSLFGSNARTHLEFEMTDGTVFRRKILSAQQAITGGHEELTLTTPLPAVVSEATLNRSSWFELVRLTSDEVVLDWQSDDIVACKLPVVALP